MFFYKSIYILCEFSSLPEYFAEHYYVSQPILMENWLVVGSLLAVRQKIFNICLSYM